jgi:NitT/TauT family transport system substrate-binding protein
MIRQYWFSILAGIGMYSCVSQSPENSADVRVAVLKGPSAMSMIGLIDKGFREEGKKAVFTIYNEPSQVQTLMIRNAVDIALIPGNMSAVLYNKGISFRLMSIPVWGTLFLAGEDSSITNWESLKGKRVFLMAKGATPDIVFRKLLQMHRLDPEKDVLLDYTFPNHLELFTAITAGRAPMGVLAEPFLSQAMSRNHRIRVSLDLEKEWNLSFADSVPMMQTAVMVRDSFSFENTNWLRGFNKAYLDEVSWLHQFPDSAGRLCVKYGILQDSSVAIESIKRANIHLEMAENKSEGIFRYFRTLYEFNPETVGGKMPDNEIILPVSP